MSNLSPLKRSQLLEERRKRSRRRATVAVILLTLVIATVALVVTRSLGQHDEPEPAGAADTRTNEASASVVATPAALPSAEATAASKPSGPATITVAAVGDMIFDRRVKELIASRGGTAPLANVSGLLSRPDVTVGNLESPLSNSGTRLKDKDVTFRGDPRGVEGLAASGFDFVSLANNHVLDYGTEALEDTIAILDENGVGHAGAGGDRDAAWKPAVLKVEDASVAFLSFSHILPAGFIATSKKSGLAAGRTDMDAVGEAIAAAKKDHDYVLVSFHWGVEYVDDANADQVKDARRAIDAGADMVLSHHPHVIQGIEFYKKGLIAYSLGDFVFDHYSRKTGEAFILNASLGRHGVHDVSVTPVYLDSMGSPDVVTGSAAKTILERLKVISGKHGTNVRIKGDSAVVAP